MPARWGYLRSAQRGQPATQRGNDDDARKKCRGHSRKLRARRARPGARTARRNPALKCAHPPSGFMASIAMVPVHGARWMPEAGVRNSNAVTALSCGTYGTYCKTGALGKPFGGSLCIVIFVIIFVTAFLKIHPGALRAADVWVLVPEEYLESS